jgi:hypothetical protein
MRRSTRAAVLAASLLLAVGMSGFALAACGGSATSDARAQAAPSGMPQANGQMGDPSTMIARQLDSLVEDGTITSDQQTAVVAAIKASMPGGSGGAAQGAQPSPGAQPSAGAQPPDRGAMFSTALDALVEKGTITAAQQTVIEAALTQSMPGPPGGAAATPAAGV